MNTLNSTIAATPYALAKRSSMIKFLALLIAALMLALATDAWLKTTLNPLAYFTESVPPGQSLYVLSKLLGLYAAVLLGLQLTLGIAAISILRDWHRALGVIVVAAITLHALLFVAAVSLRSQQLSLGVLIPKFNAGPYDIAIALGIIAFGLVCVVLIAGLLRRHLTTRFFWLHRLAYLVGVLGFFHSIWIGSETRNIAVLSVYIAIGLSLLFAIIKRILRHRERLINAVKKQGDDVY